MSATKKELNQYSDERDTKTREKKEGRKDINKTLLFREPVLTIWGVNSLNFFLYINILLL